MPASHLPGQLRLETLVRRLPPETRVLPANLGFLVRPVALEQTMLILRSVHTLPKTKPSTQNPILHRDTFKLHCHENLVSKAGTPYWKSL